MDNNFKVKFDNNQITVKKKLEGNEFVSQRDMNVFASKYIRGLMKPSVSGKKGIEYTAPGNISLFDFLHSGITQNDFFVVFAQYIECIKKIERNGFNANNLVLDTRFIFYNTVTKEVQFIYQPLENSPNRANIFSFIYSLGNETVLRPGESFNFLSQLIGFFRNMQTFSVTAAENYIMRVYPQVYKQVKRSKPGDSQVLKREGWNYFDEKTQTDVKGANNQDGNPPFIPPEPAPIPPQPANFFDPSGDTDVLFDDEDDGSGATTVLNDGTDVLEDPTPSYPYIIRLNTFERADVNKPVFRVGKEKSYVDYFVVNNNAVSRIHADIITQNGRYYIKDNNSTNHTFVNGTVVPPGVQFELSDGDAIMLANEPFEFHVK